MYTTQLRLDVELDDSLFDDHLVYRSPSPSIDDFKGTPHHDIVDLKHLCSPCVSL